MSFYVMRNSPSEFFCKVVNEDSYEITLANMAHRGVTPSGAFIKMIAWSAGGNNQYYVSITRNSVNVAELHGTGCFQLGECDLEFGEEPDQPITIESAGNGDYMLLLGFRKA